MSKNVILNNRNQNIKNIQYEIVYTVGCKIFLPLLTNINIHKI
jgi:hypothetical protein